MINVSNELAHEENSPLLKELTHSYSIDIRVAAGDIDGFGHVNNANYIQWLDQVHWSHLSYLGISASDIFEENCGFVVRHTDVTYLAPLTENELVKIGTAITEFDERFRLTRSFQLLRLRDNVTVLRGKITYVAVNITRGTPKRIPQKFIDCIASAAK